MLDTMKWQTLQERRLRTRLIMFHKITNENIAIPFTPGETVKVIDGPFNGFDGTVENINEDKRKLEVMVKIFGRKTPLELSYMQVEKV